MLKVNVAQLFAPHVPGSDMFNADKQLAVIYKAHLQYVSVQTFLLNFELLILPAGHSYV